MHAFFACEKVARAWFQSPLALHISYIKESEMTIWLGEFIKKEELEVVETLTTTAHDMWLARNKLIFEGKHKESSLVISGTLSILHTYQQANKHPTREVSNLLARSPIVYKWMPARRQV